MGQLSLSLSLSDRDVPPLAQVIETVEPQVNDDSEMAQVAQVAVAQEAVSGAAPDARADGGDDDGARRQPSSSSLPCEPAPRPRTLTQLYHVTVDGDCDHASDGKDTEKEAEEKTEEMAEKETLEAELARISDAVQEDRLDEARALVRLGSQIQDLVVKSAQIGDLATMKWLLEFSASTLGEDDHADVLNWALFEAAGEGQLTLVKWLVEEGGATELNSALYWAAFDGKQEVVEWLEGKDADSITALNKAACNGHLHVVKWLVEDGGATNPDKLAWARYLAAAYGKLEVDKWLAGKGAKEEPTRPGLALLVRLHEIHRDDRFNHCAMYALEGLLLVANCIEKCTKGSPGTPVLSSEAVEAYQQLGLNVSYKGTLDASIGATIESFDRLADQLLHQLSLLRQGVQPDGHAHMDVDAGALVAADAGALVADDLMDKLLYLVQRHGRVFIDRLALHRHGLLILGVIEMVCFIETQPKGARYALNILELAVRFLKHYGPFDSDTNLFTQCAAAVLYHPIGEPLKHSFLGLLGLIEREKAFEGALFVVISFMLNHCPPDVERAPIAHCILDAAGEFRGDPRFTNSWIDCRNRGVPRTTLKLLERLREVLLESDLQLLDAVRLGSKDGKRPHAASLLKTLDLRGIPRSEERAPDLLRLLGAMLQTVVAWAKAARLPREKQEHDDRFLALHKPQKCWPHLKSDTTCLEQARLVSDYLKEPEHTLIVRTSPLLASPCLCPSPRPHPSHRTHPLTSAPLHVQNDFKKQMKAEGPSAPQQLPMPSAAPLALSAPLL